MVLSDYEMIAFDSEGELCNGIMRLEEVSVKIYRDFVQVEQRDMWKYENTKNDKPVIATINNGDCVIRSVEIRTKRYQKQSAVFTACKTYENLMVGIGAYGRMDMESYYVKKLNLNSKLIWVCGVTYNGSVEKQIIQSISRHGVGNCVEVPGNLVLSYDDQWVGITKNMYRAFIRFLERLSDESFIRKSYVDKIKKYKPLRVNQSIVRSLPINIDKVPYENIDTIKNKLLKSDYEIICSFKE